MNELYVFIFVVFFRNLQNRVEIVGIFKNFLTFLQLYCIQNLREVCVQLRD